MMAGTLWCFLDLHRWRWQFVGNRDSPDAYIRTCKRCGIEK